MSNFNLDHRAEIYTVLIKEKPLWWNNLKAENDIYIDIRKNNEINVYYIGLKMMRLKYSKITGFIGDIHIEYIPLKSKRVYISYDFKDNNITINKNQLDIIDLNSFDKSALKKVKGRMSIYKNKYPERVIQADFVLKDGYFIDTEYAFSKDSNDDDSRVDLIRIDNIRKNIIFYELKRPLIPDCSLMKQMIEKQ
jgi:hypothetical protein